MIQQAFCLHRCASGAQWRIDWLYGVKRRFQHYFAYVTAAVHLSMLYSFQATGCFPTWPLSKQWTAVTLNTISPRKEYWPSRGSNQRPPVLKSRGTCARRASQNWFIVCRLRPFLNVIVLISQGPVLLSKSCTLPVDLHALGMQAKSNSYGCITLKIRVFM